MTVNCMTDEPQLNVSHLIVANLPEGGLAACGYVYDPADQSKFHADRGGPDGEGECRCAPADLWPRCPGCVTAQTVSAARKAERGRS